VIEAVWQKLAQSRRPTLLPPPATGTGRHRPAKDHRRQATRPPGVLPAVHPQLTALSGSRTRWMSEQATRATGHPLGAVGRATSRRKEKHLFPAVDGSSSARTRDPSLPAPIVGMFCYARVARVFRRHSREVNGCQGEGAHAFVPRPRAMQATGGPGRDHHRVIKVVNHRLSNSIRLDSDAGARAQPISSHQLLPTRRHPVVVDAMSVANRVATPISMGQAPCLHRHHRPRDPSSAANEDVTRPATRQVSSHQRQMFQTSQPVQLRDQP